MNYEDLYRELMPVEKKLKDAATGAQRSYKAIAKYTENGDIKALQKEVANYKNYIDAQSEAQEELDGIIQSFDAVEYVSDGDFAGQLLDACNEQNVDIIGDYPSYEVFPYTLKVDAEDSSVTLSKKKIACIRPEVLVAMLKTNVDRLMKSSFNAQAFLEELYNAYVLFTLKGKKKEGADLFLLDLYNYMVPMKRFRKDYDKQAFAYELSRLYSDKSVTQTSSGMKFQLGESRKAEKTIRFLDANGKESFFATIRFYKG